MSTLYYLACHDCRKAFEIAKNGRVWVAPPEHVKRLSQWLETHEGHRLEYVSEYEFDEKTTGPGCATGYENETLP